MESNNLSEVATVDLSGCSTVGAMAAYEGWDPALYALTLAENIRETCAPLDRQRERLAALSGIGARADKAAAEELSYHYTVLDSLFQRFALEAGRTLDRGGHGAADRAERLLGASVKAQRACVAVFGALKVIREPKTGGSAAISAGSN